MKEKVDKVEKIDKTDKLDKIDKVEKAEKKLEVKPKFTPNYEILKEIAENLRLQREVNIDELVPMIEKATKAYKICKDRLEEVKLALAEYIPQNTDSESSN